MTKVKNCMQIEKFQLNLFEIIKDIVNTDKLSVKGFENEIIYVICALVYQLAVYITATKAENLRIVKRMLCCQVI